MIRSNFTLQYIKYSAFFSEAPKSKAMSRSLYIKTPNGILFVGLFFLLSFLFYIYQLTTATVCCDAIQYVDIAKNVNKGGSLAHELRTYGYPFFLAAIDHISLFLKIPFSFLVWFLQAVIYISAISSLCKSISRIDEKTGGMTFVVLCLNIFTIPYLGISLSDGLSASLVIFVLSLIIKQSAPAEAVKEYFLDIFLLVLLSSFAVVVRPANIWVLAPVSLVLFYACKKRPAQIGIILSCVVFGLLPLYLQVSLNAEHFNRITFLPVVDLGGAQIRWGIENVKYATWLGDGGPQNFYPSSFLINSSDSHLGVGWYLKSPIDGAKLLLVKLFSGFDFDYLVPYPRSSSRLNFVYSFVSLSILFFGILGIAIHSLIGQPKALGPRFVPALFFGGWCAVTLASAIELRFTLPLLPMLIISAVGTSSWVRSATKKVKLLILMSYLSYMTGAIVVLKLVRAAATIQQ